MEGGGKYKGKHIYLSLTYPINYCKSVTVGLFKDLEYEAGVLLSNKKRRILLEFSEWNYLMLLRGNKIETPSCMLLCEEDEDRSNKKRVIIKRYFGIKFIQIEDSKNEKFVFSETEWTRFVSLLKLLNKHLVRLFYDQEHFKSYINQVVSMGRYVPPTFFFRGFFRGENTRYDQQLTFDRLYDELVMEGQVGEIFELQNHVLDTNTDHSSV